jgi:hypothetical protein
MVVVSKKTKQHSRLTGFLLLGLCFLHSQLAYSAGPIALLPSSVNTSNADLLTQAQKDTINKYKIGEYYSYKERIVGISSPKKNIVY